MEWKCGQSRGTRERWYPSRKGKTGLYFGFGSLPKDPERRGREARMKTKLSGAALAKEHQVFGVVVVFDNCRTLGGAMFSLTFAAGLTHACRSSQHD